MEKAKIYSTLILDDEIMVLRPLEAALRKRGFITWGTTEPEEALRFVQVHKPSVACIDLHMARINGVEVIKKMRDAMPDIRIVIVTAHLGEYKEQVKDLDARVVEKGTLKQTIRELEETIAEELSLKEEQFKAIATREKKKSTLRILFIDDESEAADFCCEVATEEEIEAESAHSSEEALEIAKEFKPNVICTDLEMPKLNGEMLIKKMKESGEYPFVKLYVGMTGFFHEKERFFNVGVKEVLTKPFSLNEFIEALQRWEKLIQA